MDVKIYAKNIELNSHAEQYIHKKFNRLEHHLKSISDAALEVFRTSARSQNQRVITQMTLTANGYTLRGQESGANLFTAIDAVTDVVDRQIQRYKGKIYWSAQGRKGARTQAALASSIPATVEEDLENELVCLTGKVVRTKGFAMTPMHVEDCILQMEILSHDFFLFYNIDTT